MRTNLLIAGIALCGVFAVGCQSEDPNKGMSNQQLKAAETIDSLIAKSGGKWDNLSPEEKDKVMKQWNVDEATAKADFERSGYTPPQAQPGQTGKR